MEGFGFIMARFGFKNISSVFILMIGSYILSNSSERMLMI